MDSSQPRGGQPPPSVANCIRRKRLYNNFECANKLLYHCSEWYVPASPTSSPSNSHYLGIDSLFGASVYGGVPGSPTDAHAQWMIVPNSDNSIRYPLSIISCPPQLSLFARLLIELSARHAKLKDW
jgi:hypothetical protein